MKRAWLWVILPLVLLAALIGIFLTINPLGLLGVSAPPIENLTVERTVLDKQGISLLVRAGGSEPMQIAQIQVDGAYWEFSQNPPGTLSRLATAWINLPYPWVQDETHHIKFITNTGLSFEHEIAVAVPTPQFSLTRVLAYALLGLYIGIVPVGLGMLFYPSLKALGGQGIKFLLALTIGMLAFLLVDTIESGLELASKAASAFSGSALVWLVTAASFLAIFTVGRRGGKAPEGTALATYLAFSIGLHNLGEGLAIGAAFAIGEAALGSLLVVGFTLHNITEGIGIAAPLVELRPKLTTFLGLTALAGLPAVLGTWMGAFAFSPLGAALFLGIGAGAIVQVMVEVGSYLARTARKTGGTWLSRVSFAGFSLGLAVMYATALFVNF
ncbi:MAG: Zinc transporter ZupT [Chroococcidiopsis cubana SAG 39.79]|uniref:Metal transporter n=1 Tax=Chroococcidiopsis cubana SAG 39.79 TaxID=388085 RepID=A0AB37US77_9CYAN|nr:metal transporter [Chroococcidiopsis cubana]MDZ4877925.1 Zinc transporter ZupT [Chroococcidiopsis cubana SAG 39.79]PSB66356.1 metal transporter [Chroococcidiopsis cubana CCALA 043]RUT14190.1 metal transporter [Chroococcidiopsis cubana SAG 39.79]